MQLFLGLFEKGDGNLAHTAAAHAAGLLLEVVGHAEVPDIAGILRRLDVVGVADDGDVAFLPHPAFGGSGRHLAATAIGTEILAGSDELARKIDDLEHEPVDGPCRKRLRHEFGDAAFAGRNHVLGIGRTRKHDEREEPIRRILGAPQPSQQQEPVDRGHDHVGNDDVEIAPGCGTLLGHHLEVLDRLLAVACGGDATHPKLAKKVLEDVTDVPVVLDEKDVEPLEIVNRHVASSAISAAHDRQSGGEVQHNRPASGLHRTISAGFPIVDEPNTNARSAYAATRSRQSDID